MTGLTKRFGNIKIKYTLSVFFSLQVKEQIIRHKHELMNHVAAVFCIKIKVLFQNSVLNDSSHVLWAVQQTEASESEDAGSSSDLSSAVSL